jgi:hypothetical protein
MDISAQGLKMFLELNKYHTQPNGTFFVNILILNFNICCSNSSFSFFYFNMCSLEDYRVGCGKGVQEDLHQ